MVDFMMVEGEKCPNCSCEVTEKTRVVWEWQDLRLDRSRQKCASQFFSGLCPKCSTGYTRGYLGPFPYQDLWNLTLTLLIGPLKLG